MGNTSRTKKGTSKKGETRNTKRNNGWLFLVVLATLVISVILLIPALEKRKESESLRELQNAYMESVAEASSWAEELEEMRNQELTDEQIIEIAREKFGLVFPDEIQFVPEEQ